MKPGRKTSPPFEVNNIPHSSKIDPVLLERYFNDIINYPDNGADPVILLDQLAITARRIISFWTQERFDELKKNFLEKKFTDTTEFYINFQDIKYNLERVIVYLKLYEDNVLSNKVIPNSYSQFAGQCIMIANLMYSLHYLDDSIIEAKAKAAARTFSEAKQQAGAETTKSIKNWWKKDFEEIAYKYLDENKNINTYISLAKLMIGEIKKSQPSNSTQPLTPENLAREISRNPALAKMVKSKRE